MRGWFFQERQVCSCSTGQIARRSTRTVIRNEENGGSSKQIAAASDSWKAVLLNSLAKLARYGVGSDTRTTSTNTRNTMS